MGPSLTMDLWEYLLQTDKAIVLYGMGNGADKILDVCRQKGIAVRGVFASDGFVRQKLFHGMPIRSWREIKEEFGAHRVIVLLSFGTSLPDVLDNILSIADEAELYAPDVPAFGDGLFDRAFFESHREELEAARALLADDASRRIFDLVLTYKLTGDIRPLLSARSDANEVWNTLLHPTRLRVCADLGAYNGDTVRELIERSEGCVERIYAMEPDARNFKKLAAYAEGEERCEVLPIPAGAWSEDVELFFDKSGNRNASFGVNRSAALEERPAALTKIEARRLDTVLSGQAVDYIKYDVEGSEREAILGSCETIRRTHPTLLVSLYHRNEDLFSLPLLLHSLFPQYNAFYLRRFGGVPAWDLNLYVKKEP